MARRTGPLLLRSTLIAGDRASLAAPVARPAAGLRRLLGIAALVLLSVVGLATPAGAVEPELPEIIAEGGTPELRAQLEGTQTAWLDAKVALDASVARQQELEVTLVDVEAELEVKTEALGKVAHVAFISAGHTSATAIMSNASIDGLLDGLGLLDALATRETTLIQDLLDTQAQARAAQAGIDQEIATQSALLLTMDERKQQAQSALCRAAGGCAAEVDGTFSEMSSSVAQPAPRNPDGSWPVECIPRYCDGYPYVIEKDVTGHPQRPNPITPRLAHMIRQAKAAGFTGYVTCFRWEDNGGEHPRGRACDFSVRNGGKSYGDQLAAFLIFNAERLGVLYIVWYRQIWLVSTGRWKPYSGCCDPSSMHTDHVHVSIR
jgi:hypothetical protein